MNFTECPQSIEAEATGGKILLDKLFQSGVKYIFAIPGRESEAILFNESPELKVILTSIELTAGFAAYAHAIVSGKTQVVFSTLGPGAANLANAIYSACADRVPVVFIAAQVERSKCFYNNTHQCVDTVEMYKSVSKYALEINGAEELPSAIEKAFQITQVEPKGPAVISIPIDVLKQKIKISDSLSKTNCILLSGSYPVIPENSKIDHSEIGKVISILKAANQPLVYIGNEVIRSGSVNLIRRLCTTYDIPMISAYDSKGVLPSDSKLNYFAYTNYASGILGFDIEQILFEPVDCVLAFGYDLKDDVFPAKHFSRGRDKTLINFSSYRMPEEIASQFLHIQGNLYESLDLLLEKMNTEDFDFNQPYDISPLKKVISIKQKNIESPKGYVNVISVINAINEAAAVLVSDVGTFRHYSVLFGNTDNPNFFLTSAGSSSFGTGLPIGLGACLAHPSETKVIVLTGDGGFNSIVGDLRTLKMLDLNIVIIVLNNNENGLIGIYQQKGHKIVYPPAYSHSEVSFVRVAQGYACKAFKVSSGETLSYRISEAFEKKKGPTVIEVPVYYSEEDVYNLTNINYLA
ncbi:MAG: thiamine pyrophosphate-binding protein [Cyanobacteria bacterium P01_F01_bin.33]